MNVSVGSDIAPNTLSLSSVGGCPEAHGVSFGFLLNYFHIGGAPLRLQPASVGCTDKDKAYEASLGCI